MAFIDNHCVGAGTASTIQEARQLAAAEALGMKTGSLELPSPLFRLVQQHYPAINDYIYRTELLRFLGPSGGEPSTEINKQDRVKKYLDGLTWTMEYMRGRCADYGYRYPYSSAPSVHELCQYLRQYRPCPLPPPTQEATPGPLTPLTFYVALTPSNSPNSAKYLPDAYQSLLSPESELADLFHHQNSEQFWQRQPEIAVQRVCAAVERLAAEKSGGGSAADIHQDHHRLLKFHPTLLFKRAKSEEKADSPPTDKAGESGAASPKRRRVRSPTQPAQPAGTVHEGLILTTPGKRFTPITDLAGDSLSCFAESRDPEGTTHIKSYSPVPLIFRRHLSTFGPRYSRLTALASNRSGRPCLLSHDRPVTVLRRLPILYGNTGACGDGPLRNARMRGGSWRLGLPSSRASIAGGAVSVVRRRVRLR
jgi:hypothetical protein